MPQQPASSSTTSAPGIRSSSARVASVPTPAFSWQWPWKTIRAPCSAEPGRSVRSPASIARTRRWETSRAWPATASARGSPGSRARYSSRSVSRHDGSTPTIAVPRAASAASRSTIARAIPCAWSSRPLERLPRPPPHPRRLVEQALGEARPPAAAAALQAHAPAGALEERHRRPADRRLGERCERGGEQDDLAARRRRLPPRPPCVPAQQRLALEARQRPLARDPERAVEQRPRAGHAGRGGRHRRQRRADAVERPDRPERARAQRRAVDLLVVGEELAL